MVLGNSLFTVLKIISQNFPFPKIASILLYSAYALLPFNIVLFFIRYTVYSGLLAARRKIILPPPVCVWLLAHSCNTIFRRVFLLHGKRHEVTCSDFSLICHTHLHIHHQPGSQAVSRGCRREIGSVHLK